MHDTHLAHREILFLYLSQAKTFWSLFYFEEVIHSSFQCPQWLAVGGTRGVTVVGEGSAAVLCVSIFGQEHGSHRRARQCRCQRRQGSPAAPALPRAISHSQGHSTSSSVTLLFPLLTELKHSYFTVVFARHPDSSLLQSTSMLHWKNMQIKQGAVCETTYSPLLFPTHPLFQIQEFSRETHPFLYTRNRLKFTAPQQQKWNSERDTKSPFNLRHWTKIWRGGEREKEGACAEDSHNFYSKTTLLLITGIKRAFRSYFYQTQSIAHHAFTFWTPENTLAVLQHTINLPLTEIYVLQKKDDEI